MPVTQILMNERLLRKEATLAVIGLGYVGLPVALEFAKHCKVIGFDIQADRVELMKKGIDPSNEIPAQEFKERSIIFTANPDDLAEACFYIVAVPTPVDDHKVPDLRYVKAASETVGKVLKSGDYVVFESTVFPGCTEEDCLPILEQVSGLNCPKDFKLGYSPERINPGDKKHTITKITKVVSGCDEESGKNIAKVYEMIISAGVHLAPTIKVAEAAKIIENTQRDLNIALMNELSIIFDKMDIDTWDVLEAAGTKWNFLNFFPGLVGGHCIGVDPYYLTYKSTQLGYVPHVILSGRSVNDNMSAYVAKKAIQMMIRMGKDIKHVRILIMGATFKENVSDIRNSRVFDLIKEIEGYSVLVHVTDPYASESEVMQEYGVELMSKPIPRYDCVVVAVSHDEYKNLEEQFFLDLCTEKGVLIDIKGVYKNRINNLEYWTL